VLDSVPVTCNNVPIISSSFPPCPPLGYSIHRLSFKSGQVSNLQIKPQLRSFWNMLYPSDNTTNSSHHSWGRPVASSRLKHMHNLVRRLSSLFRHPTLMTHHPLRKSDVIPVLSQKSQGRTRGGKNPKNKNKKFMSVLSCSDTFIFQAVSQTVHDPCLVLQLHFSRVDS